MSIRRSLKRIPGRGVVIGPTKTTRSTRPVDLSAETVQKLKDHRHRQLEEVALRLCVLKKTPPMPVTRPWRCFSILIGYPFLSAQQLRSTRLSKEAPSPARRWRPRSSVVAAAN